MISFIINILLCKYIITVLTIIPLFYWISSAIKFILVSVILPVFVAIAVLVIWEWSTAPKLKIFEDKDWGTKHDAGNFMYYHLNIKNEKTCFVSARKPAMSCKIEIEVFRENGTKVELHKNEDAKFYARWRFHPEPIFLLPEVRKCLKTIPNSRHIKINEYPDKTKIYTFLENNVYTHDDDQQITILIKYEGDSACYMFNNESFLHPGFKHTSFHLKGDVFYLKLKAYYYNKRPSIHFFELKNTGTSYKQLKLEKIDKEKFDGILSQ